MLHRLYRYLRFGLLMLLTTALITACNGTFSNSISTTADRLDDCKVVQHAGGETCVPLDPKRVVALDSGALEYLFALGIKPIGVTLSDTFASQLQQDLTGIADVGNAGEPSLEKIVALQPDLIVGMDYYQTLYSQASQIAPTVLFNMEYSGQWKETFRTVARMLHKAEAAERVMNDYAKRLDEFKHQMGDRLQQTKVSVVRIYPDTINLYLKDSFCGTVLQDAGLPRPDSQNISASEAKKRFDNEIQTSISRELLQQADGDVIFVWTGENTSEANQQAKKKLSELQSDSLWQQLNAVQQNKIYQVPSYWIGSGPITANLVIDDLFKYLVSESKNS